MNPIEVKWFRNKLDKYVEDGATIINVGSSTGVYRRKVKPHIHRDLFEPLAARNITVIHVDFKEDEGVDLVGDITNPSFVETLRQYHPAAVMCNNVLEHVENRKAFCEAIIDILPSDAYIFASVPKKYPFHPDPIDTMFRPDVNELAAKFPGTTLTEGEILECGTHRDRDRYYRKVIPRLWMVMKVKRVLRMFMPFYKSHQWLRWISGPARVHPDTPILVTCVVLKK